MKLIEFNTARLTLRQWRESDSGPFAKLNADPHVMDYFPSVLDRSQSDALMTRLRDSIAELGWGFWAVETLDLHQFIGFVGIKPNNNLSFSPCVEIGWRLAVEYWNKGYATEAAVASLQIGFEELQLDEVVSFTSIHNQRSQKVMQRLGMGRIPVTFRHPAIPDGSPLKEHVLYRMNREQWQNKRSSST